MNAKGLALLLITSTAFAGITSTEQPVQYLIRLADKTYEKGKTVPATRDECVKRAKALLPHGDCVTIEGFDNAGNCEDVAKPVLPLEKDAEGYVIKPPIRAKQLSDTDWQTEIQDYVPAAYPACWALGWRVIADADVTDDTVVADVDEPVTLPPALLAAWNSSCAERHRVNIVYEGEVCT